MAASTNPSTSSSSYTTTPQTYHTDKTSAYLLPNSSPEHDRLNTQAAHLRAIMNDQIIHSPLPPSTPNLRILDVGCGTGIVTRDLALRFPNAEVWGLDLSDVPPPRAEDGPFPSNIKGFLKGNILTGGGPSSWTDQSGEKPFAAGDVQDVEFNLIFSRLLIAGMADWPSYIATVHDLLAPGGYFEMHELNYDFYSGITGEVISESWSWLQTCRSAMEGRGLDPRSASKAHTWMAEAGFRDVVVKQYRWPFGGEWEEDEKWKAWGDYVATSMPELFWVMIGRILEGTAGKEVVERTREQMMADLRPEKGKEWRMSVVVGRKAGEK